MGELRADQSQDNVNVTLESTETRLNEWTNKEFPCPLCGAGLQIRISKAKKPYCICDDCKIQMFFRGKKGILLLRQMINEELFVSAKDQSVSHGIKLLNRLKQLKLQKEDLYLKQGIVFKDENVENAIRIVDAEIEKVEGELEKIAARREKDK